MLFRYKDPLGPANRYMINQNGSSFSLYQNNLNSFSPVESITSWAGGGLPFEVKKVGAGIAFYPGNKRFFILFNHTGTKYAISGDVFGTSSNEFIGPFDL